jgi:hypothetical protein
MKAATIPGRAMGRMIVANAPQIDSPSTSAASSSSVGIAPNWSRMIQMTMGSTGQRIEQDQPDPRVQQRQFLVEHEEGQGEHHGRQDQLDRKKNEMSEFFMKPNL